MTHLNEDLLLKSSPWKEPSILLSKSIQMISENLQGALVWRSSSHSTDHIDLKQIQDMSLQCLWHVHPLLKRSGNDRDVLFLNEGTEVGYRLLDEQDFDK